jgi:hypothetical protein
MTYTEQNMTEFLTYDRFSQQITEVHPLFAQLKNSMRPQKEKIDEFKFDDFNLKQFATGYLKKSYPVILRDMAKEWNATKYWDFDYLTQYAGDSVGSVSIFYHNKDSDLPWSYANQRPHTMPGLVDVSLSFIRNNSGSTPSMLYFMDEVKLFAPGIADDYGKPFLHQFMKMQEKTISIWPALITHMTPRQNPGEQFLCVVDGEL